MSIHLSLTKKVKVYLNTTTESFRLIVEVHVPGHIVYYTLHF